MLRTRCVASRGKRHELAIERLRRGAIDGAARGTPGRGQDAAQVPGDVGGAAGVERVVEGRITEQDNVRSVHRSFAGLENAVVFVAGSSSVVRLHTGTFRS